HHAVAVREAGKPAEARTIFEQVIKQFPGRPEAAESALRWGQCLKDEGLQKVEAARKLLAGGEKPEEVARANQVREDGLKNLQGALQHLEKEAEQLKQKQPEAEVRARMLYEAAWVSRELAEHEIEAARARVAQEQVKKLGPDAAKNPSAVPLA